MQTIESIAADYRRRAELAEANLKQVQRQIYRISLLRVVLFVGGIATAICLRHDGWMAWGGALAVTMLPFLALVKYHNRLFQRTVSVMCSRTGSSPMYGPPQSVWSPLSTRTNLNSPSS